MDFLELAKQRYSERYFDSRPVEQDKLDRILEAGRVVPAACNYQPQKFFLIRSREGLERLKTVTHFHYNVPLMILVCYDAREGFRRIQFRVPIRGTFIRTGDLYGSSSLQGGKTWERLM